MDRAARRQAIRASTRLQSPRLCPELTLALGDRLMDVWQAAEDAEGKGQLPSPFWAFAWPGGQALARFVLDHPDVVRDKRVLDFASGCGVSAVAAARAGAARVIAADIDPWAAAAIEENARAAGVEVDIREDDLVGRDEGWDVVLAGDVCYRQEWSPGIVRWLRTLAARGAHVLLGDPGRGFTPTQGLNERARYVLATTVDVEGAAQREPRVWDVLPDER
ncbi:MAG: methyltransferase [Deltaproteobacteria bacterium]|nr:methyltransferase [Deltaproteobacteria bacterium]